MTALLSQAIGTIPVVGVAGRRQIGGIRFREYRGGDGPADGGLVQAVGVGALLFLPQLGGCPALLCVLRSFEVPQAKVSDLREVPMDTLAHGPSQTFVEERHGAAAAVKLDQVLGHAHTN